MAMLRVRTVRMTRHGQMTIPKEIRDAFGLKKGSRLLVERTEDAIIYRPLPQIEDMAGRLSHLGPVGSWKDDPDEESEADD